MDDALPDLICNECALHLNVAYNLKRKCLTTEKYLLAYVGRELDSKQQIMRDVTMEPNSNDVSFNNDSNALPEMPDLKPGVEIESVQPNSVVEAVSNENNVETGVKYVRPNLMAFYKNNTVIELSDTDSDTDIEVDESQTTRVNPSKKTTNNLYECPVCPQRFSDLFSFNHHVREHERKVCKICGRTCSTGPNLLLHFSTHRPDQKTPCPNCSYTSGSRTAVCMHIRKFHNKGCTTDANDGKFSTKCNECDEYFSKIEEFRIHLKREHNKVVQNNTEAGRYMTQISEAKNLNCNICQRQLQNSVSYSLHMKLHQKNKLQYCYVCKLSFRHNMFFHFKMCHDGLPPYKCIDHCGQTFKNKRTFESHQKNIKKRRIDTDSGPSSQHHHQSFQVNGQKSSKTNETSSRLSLPANLNNVQYTIPPAPLGYAYVPIQQTKTFDCYVCDEQFDSESGLNTHTETHRLKKCKKCLKIFGNFRALAGHFKINHPSNH